MTVLAALKMDSIISDQQSYIPRYLDESVRFLRRARETRSGWPLFPGLPTNLHSTALVIKTLHLVDEQAYRVEIAEGAAYVRQECTGSSYKSAQDLIDQLTIANCEDSEPAHRRLLIDELDAELLGIEQSPSASTTKLLAQAVVAILDAGDHTLANRYAFTMLERQNIKTGAWPDTPPARNESLAATCWAVRALAPLHVDEHLASIQKSVRYILSVIEKGWNEVALGGTYPLTLIIRSLLAAGGSDTNTLPAQEQGMSLLVQEMNNDGGWGVKKGEVSGTDYTALAVAALFEGGVGRYLPCRSVEKLVYKIRTYAEGVERERDILKHKFEKRIEERCGRVNDERLEFAKTT